MSTDIQTRMILVVGTNGTGKTTLSREIFEGLNVPRKLVLTQHHSEWSYMPHNSLQSASDLKFLGQNWHFVIEEKTIWKKLKHFVNGGLLLDDAQNFMLSSTDQDVKRLYISRRQNAVHIIMVAHGLTEIPPKAFTFCTDIFLFATRDNIDSTRKNTVQNYEQLIETQRRVNERANDKTKCWVSDNLSDNWHYCEHITY